MGLFTILLGQMLLAVRVLMDRAPLLSQFLAELVSQGFYGAASTIGDEDASLGELEVP